MPKTKVSEWDTTAGNNSDVGGTNIAENCAAANVNDALRTIMAQIATALSGSDDSIITGTAGGSGDFAAFNADGDLVAATGTANVESLAGLTLAANKGLYSTAANTLALFDLTAAGRALLDDADASAQMTTLGVGMAFIESQDASNDATLVFTGFDATKYDAYVFEIGNLVPATDDVNFHVNTSTDGGSSYDSGASDYAHARQVIVASTSGSLTPVTAGDDADSKIFIGGGFGSAAGEDGFSGTFKVLHPHLAKKTIITWDGTAFNPSGFLTTTKGSGARLASEDVNAVQFSFSSGNIESGTITMYGLRSG